MKYFKYVVFAVLISFTSCGKDDEKPLVANLLVGEWEMVGYTYELNSKLTVGEDVFETKTKGRTIEVDAGINFNENPNIYTGGGSYLIRFTSEVYGQTSEYELSQDNFLNDGNWELVGNDKLILSSDQDTGQEVILEKLNSKELIMFLVKEEKQPSFESHTEVRVTFTRK